jgi:hypothetical protein
LCGPGVTQRTAAPRSPFGGASMGGRGGLRCHPSDRSGGNSSRRGASHYPHNGAVRSLASGHTGVSSRNVSGSRGSASHVGVSRSSGGLSSPRGWC